MWGEKGENNRYRFLSLIFRLNFKVEFNCFFYSYVLLHQVSLPAFDSQEAQVKKLRKFDLRSVQ